jgi:hypothetical protein
MEQQHGTPAAPEPGEDFVTGGFEDLGWQALRLAPDPGAALPPVETRFAFAHPRHGVALVDLAPAAAPEPVERLRHRLDADGEAAAPPAILHLVLADEDVWRLSMVLDSALLAAPPVDPPAEGWIDRVQRALLPAPAPAENRAVPMPVRSSPVVLPPGGKAPASIVAAPGQRATGGWRMPLLAALGLLAAGAAALQLLGPPDSTPSAPPEAVASLASRDVTPTPLPAPAVPEAPPRQTAALPTPPPAPPEGTATLASRDAAPTPPPAAALPEAASEQVAALPIPPPPPPARVPAPPASASPPPPPLPDARRVVAEAAQPAEAAPPASRPGRLRIVAHYRLGGRGAAAALTERAVPNSDVELRQVGATPDVAVVRYFAPTDQGAAMQLASRLGGGWAVQDFTHYSPRPSAGTLEVWLPRSLAGG